MENAVLAAIDNCTTPTTEHAFHGAALPNNGTSKLANASAELASSVSKADAETVTRIKSTTPLNWPVFQDVAPINVGLMANVNVSAATTLLAMTVFFVTDGNFSIRLL